MPNAVVHDSSVSVVVSSRVQLSSVVQNPSSIPIVVTTGMKGDKGELSYIKAISNIAISGQRVLAVMDDNTFTYADSSDITHIGRVAGVSIAAYSQGSQVLAQYSGILQEPTWNWELGKPVFLGLNGFLTQSINPSSLFTLVIGTPVTSTSIIVSIQQPYVM